MAFRERFMLAAVVAVTFFGASVAEARDGWGDLALSLARIDYDLSGTGTAAGIAVRTTRDFSPNVRLEIGGVFAKPEQQFGSSTLLLPEAQLQYRWRTGRLSPYVGGGVGAALVKSDFHSNWDPTLSMAVGTALRLTNRIDLTGEFRLRGHRWNFTGTTTDISAGLAWRLPSF